MKTLLILRHAKATRDAPHGDFARPLTARGRRDAAAVAAALKSSGPPVDEIITSPATRAAETADVVARAIGADAPVSSAALYEANVTDLVGLVQSLPDEVTSAMIVGHNPLLEDLANTLLPTDSQLEHLATAGLVHLDFDVTRWSDVRDGAGHLAGTYVGRG
jgi:phosphohistidine phosphatase